MRSFPVWMWVTLVLVLIGLAIGGTWLYREQERSQLAEVNRDLSAIGQLKAEQIVAWRTERLSDAGLITGSPFVSDAVAELLTGRDTARATEMLMADFAALRDQHAYEDVFLVTGDGEIVLSLTGVRGRLADASTRAVETAFTEGRATLTDIHLGETHRAPHLSAVAPIFDPRYPGREPMAAILLVTDTAKTLYPIIKSWPMPSLTAETVLVRRDGDDVLFLNELRHRSGTALQLRIPLSQSDLPATAAVLGNYGVIQGQDYRGIDVLAVALPVPGSPWAIVSKEDTSESLAVWRFRAAGIIVFVASVMALLVVVAIAVTHAQRGQQYQTLYESEAALRAMEERYGTTLRSIGDAVISTDVEGVVELINPVAESVTGWTSEEACGLPIQDVFRIVNEDTGRVLESPVERVLREGVVVGLASHTVLISKDGSRCSIADSGAPIYDAKGNVSGVVLVFRDTTEEREHERRLQESLNKQKHLLGVLGAIRDVNQIITRETDRERLIQGACECITGRFEGGSACIALVDRVGAFAGLGHAGHGGQFEQAKESLDRGQWPACALEILQSPGLVAMDQPEPGCGCPGSSDASSVPTGDSGPASDNAAFGIRLEHEGRVYGLFTATVPRVFVDDQDERALFAEMADDVAFALATIEVTKQQHELERKYAAALEATSDAVVVTDMDGLVTACNPGAEKLLGYGAGELIGSHVSNISPKELHAEQSEIMRRAIESGSVQGVTSERVRKDGTRVPVELTVNVQRDENGVPQGLVGIIRDISERLAAESAVLEQQRILDQTGSMAKIGGWEHDLTTGEAVWTGALYDIVGIERGAKPPGVERHLSYYLPEYRKILEQAYRQAAHEGVPFDLELQGRRENGEIFWCRAYGEPVHVDGKCARLRGTFQDITVLKEAELELVAQEEKYRLLADNTSDVIWVITPDERFTYVNPAAEAMLGWPPEDMIGTPLSQHCDQESHAFMRVKLMEAIAALPEVKTLTFESRLQTRDGKQVPVEIVGRVLLDQDGAPTALQGVTRDISERKRDYAEREELRSQLFQAQKMESVGRLAGGVAHDFNNMLQVILGNTEVALQRADISDELQGDLKEIRSAAQNSANLTRQLLAFARRQTAAPKVLELNETVSGMLKMLRRLIGEDIRLTWAPGPSLWAVRLDPSQIDQMLANLCVNARDAIGGVGSIDISTGNTTINDAYCSQHSGASPGEHVVLSVRDDGSGMDDSTLSEIFEPFFTTKGLGHGTGLGLSTVYGIVKQNHGWIDVESAVGRGTTFRIYLPRCEDSPDATREDSPPAESPRGSGQRILLVEDEVAILSLCEAVLGELGYSVATAATPGEALRIASRMEDGGGIDLLVTDVIMPEMNGRDLVERIRERAPDLRALFMSGYTSDVISKRGVLEDGVCFIQKPFTIDEIAAKVRDALGQVRP